MRDTRLRSTWLVAATVFIAGSAGAQSGETACEPEVVELDVHRYLRALSLDLRGVVPSVEEHRMVEARGRVPDELIDEWLSSEEFAERFERRHAELLWPNIDNVQPVASARQIRQSRGAYWLLSDNATRAYRGASNVGCLDEPAVFGPDGSIQTTESVDADGRTIRQEGYVMVRPYWNPETEIKVCAFDAQEHEVSVVTGRDCRTATANDRGCGCGPELRWCRTAATNDALTRAFADELRLRLRAIARNGEPYDALFTSRRAFVNGPLVHFYRHQTTLAGNPSFSPSPVEADRLPDLAFTDRDTWVEIELPEHHAGVLTSPAFLIRFPTNRARANRFFDAFRCQPFLPPPGGLPLDDEASAREPDLQRRTGCNYCHALLEPAAAHWGRWVESGAGYLDDATFPPFRPDCLDCARGLEACSDACERHYRVEAGVVEEEPYLGMLQSYAFLADRNHDNVERGPRQLVTDAIVDHSFSTCTVQNTASWLFGREPLAQEAESSEALARDFLAGGFDYRALVRTFVTSPTYRRVR